MFQIRDIDEELEKIVDVSFPKVYQIKIPARHYLVIPTEGFGRLLKAVASDIKSI